MEEMILHFCWSEQDSCLLCSTLISPQKVTSVVKEQGRAADRSWLGTRLTDDWQLWMLSEYITAHRKQVSVRQYTKTVGIVYSIAFCSGIEKHHKTDLMNNLSIFNRVFLTWYFITVCKYVIVNANELRYQSIKISMFKSKLWKLSDIKYRQSAKQNLHIKYQHLLDLKRHILYTLLVSSKLWILNRLNRQEPESTVVF